MNKQLLQFAKKTYQNSVDKYNLSVSDFNNCLKVYLKFIYEYNHTSDLLEKRIENAFQYVIKRYCYMKLCEEEYLHCKCGK